MNEGEIIWLQTIEKIKKIFQELDRYVRFYVLWKAFVLCSADIKSMTPKDLDVIYSKILKLKDNQYSNEAAMDNIIKYDLSKVQSVNDLKEKIIINRASSTYQQLGYLPISSGNIEEREEKAIDILSCSLHLIGIKNADQIAEDIVSRNLSQQTVNKLFEELSKRKSHILEILKEENRKYQKLAPKHRTPEMDTLTQKAEKYFYTKEKDGVTVILFKQNLTFSEHLDFCKNLIEDGIPMKRKFSKLCGLMMLQGLNNVQSRKFDNIANFKELISEIYGKDKTESILEDMFNVSHDDSERDEKILKAYQEKSEDLYVKFMAGILSEKAKSNLANHNLRDEYDTFVQTIHDRYIPTMAKEGKNKFEYLGFHQDDFIDVQTETDNDKHFNTRLLNVMAQNQSVCVHYSKVPVNAAWAVYDNLGSLCQWNAESKQQNCSEMINNFNNFMLVIGRDFHRSLEPKDGRLEFSAKPNYCIFSSEVEMNRLLRTFSTIPEYLAQRLEKEYFPQGIDNIPPYDCRKLYFNLELPEHQAFKVLRNMAKSNMTTKKEGFDYMSTLNELRAQHEL